MDGGVSFTSGTTGDYLESGWIVGSGLKWTPRPDRRLAMVAELHYSHYNVTNDAIRLANLQGDSVRIDDGYGEVWGLNVNGIYQVPFSSRANGYLTAGIGEYYRKIRMTQTVLAAGVYCDNWWGFCYPGVAPGEEVIAAESTTRFAWNVGFGIEFPVAYAGSWFIDVRYQRIETPKPTEFIPIQIGFRL
jgi:opacity protein-like surface antigen